MKVCSKCKIMKPKSEFLFRGDKKGRDGLESQCKLCKKKQNKKYRDMPKNKGYMKQYIKYRLKTDPIFKMTHYYRSRTKEALKNNWKFGHTIDLIGKTGYDLMDYFESMFYANMTRENYGRIWHVDHIKPCSSFDLSKPEEQRKCFHYTNLQPLLVIDNLKKSNKIKIYKREEI